MRFGRNTNARSSGRWSAVSMSRDYKRARTSSSLIRTLPTCFRTRRPSTQRYGPWLRSPGARPLPGADGGSTPALELRQLTGAARLIWS